MPRGTERPAARGFTLVEVAIALALLAIALAAIGRNLHASVTAERALRERTLAQWVAENRIALRIGTRAWLAPGEYGGSEVQAGMTWLWHERVSLTPNPALRRIDVRVASHATPEHTLATMVGFLAREHD